MSTAEITLSFFMISLGWVAHVLGKFRELRKAEATLTLKRYVNAHKVQGYLGIVSAIIGGIILYYYDELTPVTALGAGYMCDSILDKIGNRSASALR